MTSMRPFQIIVISVFAVAALGGILAFALFKGFGGAKPVGAVTIWGTFPEAAIQPAIDDLRRTHQEYTSIVYERHDTGTFDSELAEAIASGGGPDLIVTTQERLLAEANKLAVIPFSTISERSFRDSYLPIAYSYLTSTGTYGIPLAVDPLVLYYNRSRLSSEGIAAPPTTWEGVVGMTARLTRRSSVGIIERSALPFGTYENIPAARGIVSLLLLQAGNGIVADTAQGKRSTLATGGTNASGGTSAESAIGFYTQFADPAKLVYTWNRSIPDARQSFIAGDAAFYVGYASERTLIAASNPNLDFDMAAIPQPQTASARVDYGVVYAFAFPKAAKNSAGAYRVATALAGTPQVNLIYPALGMAPAARSLLTPPQSDPYAPIVYSQALIAKGWLSPAPGTTDRIFAAMINAIISGRMTVHDALTTADQSFNAALP